MWCLILGKKILQLKLLLAKNLDCLEQIGMLTKMDNYSQPCPKDIFAKLSGGKVFSKLDLCEAYLQIPVNKGKALYRFNRLPFGITVTPSIFQQIMDMLRNKVDFTIAYINDILTKSENKEQHAEHIEVFWKMK